MFKFPNYTQVPNEFFDMLIPELGFAEMKVLLVIIRKTMGWHKKRDRISLSQLERSTGLARQHVIAAIHSLVEKNHILKIIEGENGTQSIYYELAIEDDPSNVELPPPVSQSNPPPSNVKLPTKERPLTKETKEEREREAPPPTPPSFTSFNRLKLNNEKLEKLHQDFGEPKVKEMMERLDEYADINPKRFKQYACHASVIRKWAREESSLPKKAKPIDISRHQGLNKDHTPRDPRKTFDFSREP